MATANVRVGVIDEFILSNVGRNIIKLIQQR